MLFDLDKNNVSGLILVDYSKAFDLINHEILFAKLNVYGIEDIGLQLFKVLLQ